MLNRLIYLARTMPPKKLAQKAMAKMSRSISVRLEEAQAKAAPANMSDAALKAHLVEGVQEDLRDLAGRPRWPFLPIDEAFLGSLFERQGTIGAADKEEANAAVEGRLRRPGGDYGEFGVPPNWLRDPETNYEWPAHFHKRMEHGRPGVDVLNIWWIGCFYHLVPLGKAYAHARREGDEAAVRHYREAFRQHIEGFRQQNRFRFGQHWFSTTKVALRLVHLIWAQCLFHGDPELDDEFWLSYYKDILRHAQHVKENLEWFPVRTNHYLTNLYALYMAGMLYPEFDEAASWSDFAGAELAKEIDHHILADGVTHEGSVNYHRFVVEIFLSALLFARQHGDKRLEAVAPRTEKALEFMAHCLRPDRSLPRVGDAADIRLQHLESRDVFADPGHLFNLGAVAFSRGDFKACEPRFGEHAQWMLGVEGAAAFDQLETAQPAAPKTRSYPEGGFGLHAGADGDWLLFRSGPLAMEGVSGHGHHDQLSFELWRNGHAVLIDPGWLRYEGDPEALKYFKSTAAHNTVEVDGRSQIALEIFIYPPPERPTPELEAFEEIESETGADRTALRAVGSHALYSDLPDPVKHRRTLLWQDNDGQMDIEDEFFANGRHSYAWHFHFAAEIELFSREGAGITFRGPGVAGRLEMITSDSSVQPKVELLDGRAAPTYAHPVNIPIAKTTLEAEGSLKVCWRLTFEERIA